MAQSKTYVPMKPDEAEKFLYSVVPAETALSVDTMTDVEQLIYAETLKLHQRIDEIENQANEMMSPEKIA